MTMLVLGLLFVLVAVPFAVWQTVGVVRSHRAQEGRDERAPEPRYGAEEPQQARPTVGKAWARTTTHLD